MKSIVYRGNLVFYKMEGSGPTVILVHGFGEDGSVWDSTIEHCKNDFRLLVPDLPGSGQSPLCKEGSSMELLADVINEIMKQEEVESTILIGHSMGGYISLAFAEKHPEKLRSLGLFHSTAYADSEEKKEARRKSIEFIRQHGAAKFIRQSTPNLFSGIFREKHPLIVTEFTERNTNFSIDALVSYYEAMIARPDRTGILKNLEKPILFIMGRHDNAIPLESNISQCHLPSISYLRILEQSGHMGMIEEPGKSLPFLLNFLTETH
jgi:pimeloyl-ACP methyl ester carboxylesterase